MSDTQAAGPLAPGHHGAPATGELTLCEAVFARAWNVHGDPSRPALTAAAQRLFGVALPTAPNSVTRGDPWAALWLGPTSWLVVAAREAPPLRAYAAARDALAAAGGAVFDVSVARVGWTIAGPRAATVLAKGCPLDFHPRAFPAGSCAQSVFGHVHALFCRNADGAFTMLVARSLARDVGHALAVTGAQYGYDVLPPRPFAP